MRRSEQILVLGTSLMLLFTLGVATWKWRQSHAAPGLQPQATSQSSVPLLCAPGTSCESTGPSNAVQRPARTTAEAKTSLALWNPGPPGESPLERVKRLIAPVPAGDPEQDYLIRVFVDRQQVLVYTPSETGAFDQILHAFVCCTALEHGGTPEGTHAIAQKYRFGFMIDGSYGKYCSAFLPTMYFHGVPSYGGSEEAGVRWDEFNFLGNPASHGCIRLQAKDARWIFETCREGTVVEVHESSEGFSGLPEEIDFIKMKEGGPSWDPTNPVPQNPYQQDPSLLLPS